MTENINIIGGTKAEANIIHVAVSKLEFSQNITLYIDDDSQVTKDDLYIGKNISANTHHNFLRPIRLGSLLNSIAEKKQKQKQNLNLKLMTIDEFILDPKSFLLRHKIQEKETYLTEKETALLQYLAQSGNEVSREELLESIWGYVTDIETHTLETHLYRLRQKLENEFDVQDFIVFGDEGYYLNLSHDT